LATRTKPEVLCNYELKPRYLLSAQCEKYTIHFR
jgi:hypothetical protein